MGRIDKRFVYATKPVCNEKSVVRGDKYRFTVLTPCMIRLEYSEDGIFEDRGTQTVIDRDFPVPDFKVSDTADCLKITTECLELTYTKKTFSINTLNVRFTGKFGSNGQVWYYGWDPITYRGTTRTLDAADGEVPLEDSVMSPNYFALIDDSKSLIIDEDGWISVRKKDCIDMYIFGYRTNYLECLKDYYKLTGKTPLLPRYALGNWWSRYHAYTQNEYMELMERFEKENLPFSVAVIDMDWHYVNIDPSNGSGWTGYTWNKDLFPDYKAFLKYLRHRGMEVSLNLHPAEGVGAHEDAYENMAEAMGIDPSSGKKVDFDITNPEFIEAYFKYLHHSLEKDGVSFWWMDWQQGNISRMEGLDPLWMLNHYHYIDNGRDGKRSMLFSRFSGFGSHRYPVGFSGDTLITWKSLDFQPFFTVTATNSGYGWWSHDIGGHMGGIKDDELTTRWVQFGVFSPILRLHSSNSPVLNKEPWKFGIAARETMSRYLRMRHELIPYLYTMNYRAHEDDIPLMTPIYYHHPDVWIDRIPMNEYYFGTEMIVSPITEKSSEITKYASCKTYLPDGTWFDMFSSRKYIGDRVYMCCRSLDDIPVFVKAGGIIPTAVLTGLNYISNPDEFNILVFPGADNSFDIIEDDGRTMEYKNGKRVTTKLELKWSDKPKFIIHKPDGDLSLIPAKRTYNIEIRKVADTDVKVTCSGKPIPFTCEYRNDTLYIRIEDVTDEAVISLGKTSIPKNDWKKDVFDTLVMIQGNNKTKTFISERLRNTDSPVEILSFISNLDMDDMLRKVITEIVAADN